MAGGGIGNGILGSIIMVGLATLFSAPIGILTGIYIAAFANSTVSGSIRFLSDVLSGVPSIAIGLFAYTVLVQPFKHFSGLSAAFALGILMLPLIVRTTYTAYTTVPTSVKEGALALGLSMFATNMRVVFPAARPLIATGLLLAIARVSGETAPLLFTAFGSQFWEARPQNPMAELSLQIFTYAISPYADWHALAWGGAFLLIFSVFVMNVIARLLIKGAMER